MPKVNIKWLYSYPSSAVPEGCIEQLLKHFIPESFFWSWFTFKGRNELTPEHAHPCFYYYMHIILYVTGFVLFRSTGMVYIYKIRWPMDVIMS